LTDKDSQQAIALIPEGVDVSSYMLHTPIEIGYVLRSLSLKRDLVSIHFSHGTQSILSSILEVDVKAGRFWFDVSSINATNEALLATDRMVFVASPDGVKIQFVVNDAPSWSNVDGRAAFCSVLPDDMIKLQRREYFRLETPLGRPLICKVPLAGKMQEMQMHDISIGGMGLWLPAGVRVELMDIFQACRVDLGTFGSIEVTLEVRSNRRVTRRSGGTQNMLGCQFVNLPRHTENVLQRYIAQLERERHQMTKK